MRLSEKRGLYLGAKGDMERYVHVQGKACNVAKSGDVTALANYAQDTLGTIDLW